MAVEGSACSLPRPELRRVYIEDVWHVYFQKGIVNFTYILVDVQGESIELEVVDIGFVDLDLKSENIFLEISEYLVFDYDSLT